MHLFARPILLVLLRVARSTSRLFAHIRLLDAFETVSFTQKGRTHIAASSWIVLGSQAASNRAKNSIVEFGLF